MSVAQVIETLFPVAVVVVAIVIGTVTYYFGRFFKDSPYLKVWRIQYLVLILLGLSVMCELLGVAVLRVRASFILAGLVVFSYISYKTVDFMQKYILTQQKTILGLSTPSVQVSEGILVMPLIGVLDMARASHVTETVLQDITKTKTKTVIIDVTGISTIDTKTASHLLQVIQAIKLMGTQAIITGIRPEVSATMTQLGIGLKDVITLRNVQQALEYAQRSIKNKTAMAI